MIIAIYKKISKPIFLGSGGGTPVPPPPPPTRGNIHNSIKPLVNNFLSLWGICHTSCLPKFGHQTSNCLSIRYIVPAKISPAFQLCQKNWFCGKVCLNDFYPLLRSKSSSWIRIGIKRIYQVCFLHDLKKMEKNVKHNFGMKNKIGRFFFGPPWYIYFSLKKKLQFKPYITKNDRRLQTIIR